jgi:hypothetical protein
MKIADLTRRGFLELVASQSLLAKIACTALLTACGPRADRKSSLGLDVDATTTLIALVDQIIPAAMDMPAASESGALAYFELLAETESALTDSLQAAVRETDALSRMRSSKSLSALVQDQRREVVAAFAEANQDLFARVRTYVYEGYYLQPKVWDLLGYEPYPTGGGGPDMTPFNPARLDRVRAAALGYRKA